MPVSDEEYPAWLASEALERIRENELDEANEILRSLFVLGQHEQVIRLGRRAIQQTEEAATYLRGDGLEAEAAECERAAVPFLRWVRDACAATKDGRGALAATEALAPRSADPAGIWHETAHALLKTEALEPAVHAFERAASLRPETDLHVVSNLGPRARALLHLGRTAEAHVLAARLRTYVEERAALTRDPFDHQRLAILRADAEEILHATTT